MTLSGGNEALHHLGAAQARQTVGEVGIGEGDQTNARQLLDVDRRETLLRVTPMPRDMSLDQALKRDPVIRSECSFFNQDLAQTSRFLERPANHGVEQGIARDEIHLECDHTQQEIPVGRAFVHRA